jgi:serine/threonine protein kinase
MLSLVGYGNYAKVILVRRKANQKVYAIKIIKKKK